MTEDQRFIDDSDLRRYRHELPNMVDDLDLSPYAYRLYGHIKRRAGAAAGGECFEGARRMAAHCKMSLGMVVKAKQELAEAGLIKIKPGDPTTSTPDTITIVNVWAENLRRYQTCSPNEQGVHTVNTPVHKEPVTRSYSEHPCSHGERKNKPPEERTNEERTLSPRGARAKRKGERESRFSDEVREAYAAAKPVGDGWLHTSRDGRYDDLIERWQQTEGPGKQPAKAPGALPELSPDELQAQVNIVAEMLDAGRTLPDIHAQLGAAIRPAQWRQIASAATAQAKVRPKPAESPPARAPNVVPMTRANKIPAAG